MEIRCLPLHGEINIVVYAAFAGFEEDVLLGFK